MASKGKADKNLLAKSVMMATQVSGALGHTRAQDVHTWAAFFAYMKIAKTENTVNRSGRSALMLRLLEKIVWPIDEADSAETDSAEAVGTSRGYYVKLVLNNYGSWFHFDSKEDAERCKSAHWEPCRAPLMETTFYVDETGEEFLEHPLCTDVIDCTGAHGLVNSFLEPLIEEAIHIDCSVAN